MAGEGLCAAPVSGGAQRTSGLCADCIHRKEMRNDRGSVFIMCLRSFHEPEYPKYPRLPVLQCAGFERAVKEGG